MAKRTDYDLIIIGAGPAGMTAGVYAARKQLDTLILTGDVGGQTTWSAGIENYLGFRVITGIELVSKFEEHLRSFPIEMVFARVARLATVENGFEVETEAGDTIRSRAVIVATGKSPRMLDVPGEREYTGKGVAYCATCDGPLFSGANVAVVGGGNSGLDAVVQLMKICPRVYLVEVDEQLRADEIMREQARRAPNVEVLTRTAVREIHGEAFVNSITVEDLATGRTRRLEVSGVFIEVGLVPNSAIVKGLIPLNDFGEIPVDCASRTSLPGMYAAGDVTAVPEKQIIVAAGDGAKAALGAYSYLVRMPSVQDWSKKDSDE